MIRKAYCNKKAEELCKLEPDSLATPETDGSNVKGERPKTLVLRTCFQVSKLQRAFESLWYFLL